MRGQTASMTEQTATTSASLGRAAAAAGQLAWDRSYVFIGLLIFIAVYLLSVKGMERYLEGHFVDLAEQAAIVTNLETPIALQIQQQMDELIEESPWVVYGGVDVRVLVLARDGLTWIYVGGRAIPPPPSLDLAQILEEAATLLPASVDVVVSVPHNALVSNAILLVYAVLFLQALVLYSRATERRSNQLLAEAVAAREQSTARVIGIERELENVRQQLLEVEPAQREHGDEIRSLQREREGLQAKIAALASREEELRGKAEQAVELDQERQALEDLLEEASSDISAKETEIQTLEQRLKRATRGSASKERESDVLARRLRTLYKNLEFDDRAIGDLVALRDESMKLKAEAQMKNLADDSENVSIRRKVGGLPPQLSIFELGFAGKGRIYYTRGKQRRFRILAIGAKNSQKTDLEYLSRLTL